MIADPVSRFKTDFIPNIQSQTQAIEARAQIGGGGWDSDFYHADIIIAPFLNLELI